MPSLVLPTEYWRSLRGRAANQRSKNRRGLKLAGQGAARRVLFAMCCLMVVNPPISTISESRSPTTPTRQGMCSAVFPRYGRHGHGGVALLGGTLVLQRGTGATVIPLLGVLAGAQRLLPSLQQVYRSWATLKAYNSAIKAYWSCSTSPCHP